MRLRWRDSLCDHADELRSLRKVFASHWVSEVALNSGMRNESATTGVRHENHRI